MDRQRTFVETIEKYVERRVELMRALFLAKPGEEELRLTADRMAEQEKFRMQMMVAYQIAYDDGYRAGLEAANEDA